MCPACEPWRKPIWRHTAGYEQFFPGADMNSGWKHARCLPPVLPVGWRRCLGWRPILNEAIAWRREGDACRVRVLGGSCRENRGVIPSRHPHVPPVIVAPTVSSGKQSLDLNSLSLSLTHTYTYTYIHTHTHTHTRKQTSARSMFVH